MKQFISCLVLSFVVAALPAHAQQKPAAPVEMPPRAAGQQIPLRVQLVVSRHQGEKKISSIPYTLSVIANDNDKTSMRMGVDVPVPQGIVAGGGPTTSVPQSYQYRTVGTNIDCAARTVEGGWFKLDLAVSDSSVFALEKGGTAAPTAVAGAPSLRSFTSTFNVHLKDGQTAQDIAATDPVSGEVLRVDVTVTVLK